MEVTIIRKVDLSMKEQMKYEVIKSLADHPAPNKTRAALTLGCTVRHINRMLKGYREQGKEFFIHGNKGRKPATAIPEDIRAMVIDLYCTKYFDANFEHYTELLDRYEGITLSSSSVSGILESQYILSPKATKAKKKRVKKELEDKKKEAKSQKEASLIQSNLVAVEDAHSRRPRAAYLGELQQMDATPHEWIPGQIWHLHLAIDDASGCITGAWFDTQETLNGYYHVFHQILSGYGIPYKILTDRRSVFTYKSKNSSSLDEDTYTQFAYACKQLGVELELNCTPCQEHFFILLKGIYVLLCSHLQFPSMDNFQLLYIHSIHLATASLNAIDNVHYCNNSSNHLLSFLLLDSLYIETIGYFDLQ